MEKRIWSKPEMNEFAFAANEYVSTCYSGRCDISAGKTGKTIDIGEWEDKHGVVHKITRNLFKLFFAWNDTGDNIVQSSEVDLNNIVNMDNTPCDEPFNLDGTFKYVASPDTLFYRDESYAWKSVDEITEETEWQSAYHFESGDKWYNKTTHLCSVLNESGKS